MGVDRLLFPRPEAERIFVERRVVDGTCPSCGARQLARYPVANYLGPRMVTKCQECFYHVAVEMPMPNDKWPPWQSATADWIPSRAG